MIGGEGTVKQSGYGDEVTESDEDLECSESTHWAVGEESWLDSSDSSSERADSDAEIGTNSIGHPDGTGVVDDRESDDAYLASGDIQIGLDNFGLESTFLGQNTDAGQHAMWPRQ